MSPIKTTTITTRSENEQARDSRIAMNWEGAGDDKASINTDCTAIEEDEVIDLATAPTDIMIPSGAVVKLFGCTYTTSEIHQMGMAIDQARANGEFPRTNLAYRSPRDVIEDFGRLQRLRTLRKGLTREKWNRDSTIIEALVQVTGQINERDDIYREQDKRASTAARVGNLMANVQEESRIYNVVQLAVAKAMQKAIAQQNADAEKNPSLAGVDMFGVLQVINDKMRGFADEGRHGVNEVNLESVLEEVYQMIDHAMSDAAAPLRTHDNVLGQHSEAFGQQVNAIRNYVDAIDGHVGSLSSNINALGSHVNAVSNNAIATNTQLQILQTVLNQLPEMVTKAIQAQLPEMFNMFLGPIFQDVANANRTVQAARESVASGQKKNCGFFRRLRNIFH